MGFKQICVIELKIEDKEFEEDIIKYLKSKGYGSYKRWNPNRIEVFKIEK